MGNQAGPEALRPPLPCHPWGRTVSAIKHPPSVAPPGQHPQTCCCAPWGAGVGVPTVAMPPSPPAFTSHPDGNSGSLDGTERVGQPRGGWDRARWLRGTIGLLWHIVGSFFCRARRGAGLRCQCFWG